MARRAREISSMGKYAVILRGINEVFAEDDMMTAFAEAADKYLGEGLLAIRFYNDRVEMLVRESEKGISMDMKPLVTSFARTYNRLKENTGKVFADRFKSIPVESGELERECIEYLNGGEPAAPFKRGSGTAAAAAVKPAEKKKSIPIKTEKPLKETVPPIKEESKQETAPKPKKKKSLPSWLL
ncbi:MAG: hypothetical protein ACI4EA_11750 [Candidatus Ornithomonoglobus sp.]